MLTEAKASFRETKRAERIPGFDQAPDFIIPDEWTPVALIEAKLTEDDGTARDGGAGGGRQSGLSRPSRCTWQARGASYAAHQPGVTTYFMTNRFKDQLIVLNYYYSERSSQAIRTGGNACQPLASPVDRPGVKMSHGSRLDRHVASTEEVA